MSESHAVHSTENSTESSVAEGRTGWQHAPLWVMFAIFLLAPLVLIPAFDGQGAVIPVIATMFATATLTGLADGLFYRPTASLPVLAGIAFLGAKALYFNDGTIIYAIACGVLAALGMALGDAVAKRRNP